MICGQLRDKKFGPSEPFQRLPGPKPITERCSIMICSTTVTKSSPNQGNGHHGNRIHGMSRHPFYTVWCNMIGRCYRPSSISYPWYGAKGVKVATRWLKFINFRDDMFPSWSPGLEIDRYPNQNGDYEPGNCRWVNHHDQLRNYARNHWVEFNGERRTITDWSKHLGGAHSLVRHRLRLGWTIERALTTPAKAIKRKPRCGPKEQDAGPVTAQI